VTNPVAPITGAASTAAADPQRKKLQAAAEGFEAIMLRQMLGAARSASLGDGIFDTSASDQFRDMADAKTADSLAHKGVFGIADLLMKQYGAKLAVTNGAGTTPAGSGQPGAAQKDGAK